MPDLFGANTPAGVRCLQGFAAGDAPEIMRLVGEVAALAPFRRMVTPGGKPMSVLMTNCGALGWVSDRAGYRYNAQDPESGAAWPPMPDLFAALAGKAAAEAGFTGFVPDACLINRYEPGAKMTLHQDRNERDFTAPIVSVSLGLPAVFLWGGAARTDKPERIELLSGDVLVWGGAKRLNFHGILPLKPGVHELTGAARINLTFRRAG